MKQKIIIITGASKGIGEKAALSLAKSGHKVYATMRTPKICNAYDALPKSYRNNIEKIRLDVTKQDTIKKCLDYILEKEKRIDVLINNAGYGLVSVVEEATEDEIHHQFDVNFFGVIRLIKAVLPKMREQKSGHIINISSISGIVSNTFLGYYAATKHSVEAISASLAASLTPWNIKVTVVEPGPVATQFAEDVTISQSHQESSPYYTLTKKFQNHLSSVLNKGQPPDEIGDLISKIVSMQSPAFRYQTSESVQATVGNFIKDVNGNTWLEGQKEFLKTLMASES